ncbi:MAG TPA: single-stranded DNA-binding protein [Terracidiphilus sp.]|nr:single-stranded DNA-binding protein [Terracidiphilus sp.]
MPKSVNRTFLLGNVGKDPQINSTTGGIAANFPLATTDREKDQQGNWRDRTEWHNLVAYGRTAEIVRDYVSKGSQLFVQGKIQTRSWDDKQSGQKRYRIEIFVHDLTLLGGGKEVDETYYRGRRKDNAPRRENPAPQFEREYQDRELSPDEIPF